MTLHITTIQRRSTYKTPFRISYACKDYVDVLVVELRDGRLVGRGESIGVPYHGETVVSMKAQIDRVTAIVEKGLSTDELQVLLPPGGARNALDCALWDLKAKRAGLRIWDLLGLPQPEPLTTAFTLGLDGPETMAAAAVQASNYTLLKLKLGGEGDLERVKAVRAVRPDADIIVDANQGWAPEQLGSFTAGLADLNVSLIEQPLPVGRDDALRSFRSPVPMCADESCQTSKSLDQLKGKYQFVNIKLDKTGGLTEALRMADAAIDSGFDLMMGCMAGSSLSMAPGFVLGQKCKYVDLDGPLLATEDVPHAIQYDGSCMQSPEAALWG